MKEKQLWRRREREWNRRRGWRLRGRQTDHNQAETGRQLWEQNLILQYKHTNTHVCRRRHTHTRVYVHARAPPRALRGTYTCSHYPKEPHYTWNINGAKQSAKMEMGRQKEDARGRQWGKKEREMDESNMSLLPVPLWHLDYQQKDIHGIITFSMSMFNLYKLLISFTGVLFIPSRYKGRSSRVLKCPNADWKWHNKYFKNAYIYVCACECACVYLYLMLC